MRWERFTFPVMFYLSHYYGREVGYRATLHGSVYEIIPTNGRPNSWDILIDGEWCGETFPSVEAAQEWAEN